jgi:hypothetical protein
MLIVLPPKMKKEKRVKWIQNFGPSWLNTKQSFEGNPVLMVCYNSMSLSVLYPNFFGSFADFLFVL